MLLEQVSLGIYYPGSSLLHRLQARTKLLATLMFVVALVVAGGSYWDFTPYLVAMALVICGVLCSGSSLPAMGRRLRFLALLAALGVVIGLPAPAGISTNGRLLYVFPPLPLSAGVVLALVVGAAMLLLAYLLLLFLPCPALRRPGFRRRLRRVGWLSLLLLLLLAFPLQSALSFQPAHATPRLAFVITYDDFWGYSHFLAFFLILYPCSLLLTMTTSPVALVEALTMLLAPLRWLRLPVDDFALMTLLALRFLPTLVEEATQLLKAQSARGASFSTGSLGARAQSILALLVPFLRATLRRASELATALDARGYQVEGRQTRLYETGFALRDYLVLVVAGGLLLGVLLV
ncbi:MAG TPA: energy-coupling factor transporter transmembrane component T [Ktedonobacteraceae bacterium]